MRGLLVKLSPTTVGPVLGQLRVMLREAVEDEIIDANPALEVRVPRALIAKVPEVRAPLTKPEFEALLAAEMPLVERAMIATAALAGLRSGEVHALPLSHVEAADGLLVVHVEFGGFGGAPTKNGKARRVPVLGPARAILEEWLAAVPRSRARNPELLAFPGPQGGRRDYNHAGEWLRVRLRAAGVEKAIRFHDLRHTAGTALENGWFGPPLAREHVQAILGHATLAQTEHYTGGAGEAMLRAVRTWRDQDGISAPDAARENALSEARTSTTARRTPCSAEKADNPEGWPGFDPSLILATERLVADLACRRATRANVRTWLDALIASEPEPWASARRLKVALHDSRPTAVAEAIELARRVMEQVEPARAAAKERG